MSDVVLLNGEFIDAGDAKVSAFDGGFLHGAGLFETMRAENERVFRLQDHYARLCRSASMLLVPVEQDQLPHAEKLADLMSRNNLTEARIRVMVTAGGMRAQSAKHAPNLTVCATASTLSEYPKDLYERGIGVVVSRFRQTPKDPIAGHKTTCYLPRLLALREAQQARCMEAIWFSTKNHLAEGSISNVFIVRDGTLKTPPLDTPVLPGIARDTVLQLAKEAGIPAEETVLSIDDLLDANEVLLTNSIMQVMPVVKIEKKDVGDGRVGPIAKKLYAAYRTRVRKECRVE